MTGQKKQIGDILVDAGIITAITLQRALERQKGTGKRLGVVLVEMGVVTEEELVQALARQVGLKTVKNIADHPFSAELLARVPEDIAALNLVFPLMVKDGALALAMCDPFDSDTIDFISKKNGLKVMTVLATRTDILAAIKKYYLAGKEEAENVAKILVVEDSSSIATIIRVALEKEGFEVFVGQDGLEGLKLALAHKPDLIICDSIMPRLDGFGMRRAIAANPQLADIPMILLTSKASSEDEQRALEAGFFDFIPKPVQPIRILSRVRHAFSLMKNMKKSG